MQVTRQATVPAYRRYLDHHPQEADLLLQDMLISVTSFFRDHEAFKALEREVEANFFDGRPPPSQVRAWVVGCATGEEAYSLAMLLNDHVAEQGARRRHPVVRLRHRRPRPRRGACRRLSGRHRGRRADQAAAAVLRQGAGRLPRQEDPARAVAVRPAQPAARSAFLAPGPDQLPQPADLPGARRTGAGTGAVPLRAQPGRPAAAGQRGVGGVPVRAVHPRRQEAPDLPCQRGSLGPPRLVAAASVSATPVGVGRPDPRRRRALTRRSSPAPGGRAWAGQRGGRYAPQDPAHQCRRLALSAPRGRRAFAGPAGGRAARTGLGAAAGALPCRHAPASAWRPGRSPSPASRVGSRCR